MKQPSTDKSEPNRTSILRKSVAAIGQVQVIPGKIGGGIRADWISSETFA
jgi:hypothetical protein